MQYYCHICRVESTWSVLSKKNTTLISIDTIPDFKFDLMYSKRAFVHWYVGEGMEEVRRLFFALQ